MEASLGLAQSHDGGLVDDKLTLPGTTSASGFEVGTLRNLLTTVSALPSPPMPARPLPASDPFEESLGLSAPREIAFGSLLT